MFKAVISGKKSKPQIFAKTLFLKRYNKVKTTKYNYFWISILVIYITLPYWVTGWLLCRDKAEDNKTSEATNLYPAYKCINLNWNKILIEFIVHYFIFVIKNFDCIK